MSNISDSTEFNLHLQFLLKDCYQLISETIEEEIELFSWDFEERQCMLSAIDELMAIINDEKIPKFVLKKERHLKIVKNIKNPCEE